MPSYVNPEKCDGCKGQDKTACMHICPNDLMILDKEAMRAWNLEPDMCWECYSCVKICPQQAVEVRGYADFVPLGASVTPMRGSDSIMWTVKFRDGSLKRFKFPIRRKEVPEGEAKPTGGFATDAAADDLKSPLLATEPASCKLPALPTL